MSKNMKKQDRCLRAFVIAPAAIATGVRVGPWAKCSAVLYAAAAVMLATSAAGYCPLYSVLKVGRSDQRPSTD
ncbi:MAG: YgaP family membrane protein [Solirubrobacteraceae bacterium]